MGICADAKMTFGAGRLQNVHVVSTMREKHPYPVSPQGAAALSERFLPSFKAVGHTRVVGQNRNPYNPCLTETVGYRRRLHEKWPPPDFLCWAPEHPYDHPL